MPEQHAHVLYTKLLLSRGHGYPLWTPEPDYSLCPACVERGICVGDVGIIRDDGGFDFIFNAFLEADDPVHEGGVPPNFSPLRTEAPNPIRTIYFQHPRDSSVRSSHVSVKSVTLEASAEVPSIAGGGAGFEFATSKDQAAVLMLPQGGTRFDRKNISSMRNYALEHAHEWYEYINSPNYLGREALNGSLCFVTGCDKTKAWGSAAMSKPSDTREFSIKFLVGGLSEGRIALRSSWSTQEWTDTRIYPDQDIDMEDPLPVRENQGVFIRGFTISVREKSWKTKIWPGLGQRVAQLAGVSGKSGNLPVVGSRAPYSDQRHDLPPVSVPVWAGNGDTIRGSIVGNELMQLQISIINAHMKSFGESHQRESISDYPSMSSISHQEINNPAARQSSSDEQDHIVLQYFPERSTELLNPSVKFNEYILSTDPESDVVVTHDSVWMLPMLVADIFISGLSAPRFLIAGKPPSYVRSKRGRMKRTLYFKARVRKFTPDLKEIKASTLFLSFEYAMIFSCLFIPLAPLQVDTELPDYVDQFPTFNTSLVLEFAKGASYIFREIPLSKEPLQIQGARNLQGSRRPQSVHQNNLVIRYDGVGLVGCITEAVPVFRSTMLTTTAFRTLESVVAEINLLASPPILENKSLTNFSHPGIHNKEDMVHVSPELDVKGSAPPVHISSYTYVPHQPRRQPSLDIHQPFTPHAPSVLFTPHQSPSDDGDESKTPAHPSVVTNRYDMLDPNRDYRTDLNNLCMQYRWSLDFEESFSGPQHNGTWTSTVSIDGVVFGRGSASSVRASREKASYQTLVLLGRA